MKRQIILPASLSILLAGTALAVEPDLGASLGTSFEDISAALSVDGYELTRYEREGDRIEVYAVRGDTRYELYVDADSGEVTSLETATRRGPTVLPGASNEQIRASLAALGYEITGFEREQGEIEVYAVRDGRRWELNIDPRSGGILRLESED